MDEVDGRPGHVALQSGHLDALADVPVVSLSLPFHSLTKTTKLVYEKIGPTAGGKITGEYHENLPGK
jgi:hypothetical protein